MKEFEQALKRAKTLIGNKTGSEDESPAPDIDFDAAGTEDSPKIRAVEAPPVSPIQSYADPIENHLEQLPVLSVDYSKFKDNFGGAVDSGRGVDSAYRSLRTQILGTMKEKGHKSIGVVSAIPGAGKTVTSINLALACARRSEQITILADFDFRRPSIASYLQAKDVKASLGYFRGDGSVYDYLYRNEAGNLMFLLTDRSTEMSAEYLASEKMDRLLETLAQIDDQAIIIADLPPLTGCDDTMAIMPKLDCVLPIIAAGENSFGIVEQAFSQLPPEKIVATVLNKAATNPTYGYGYYE